jgi:carbonic anhydrase
MPLNRFIKKISDKKSKELLNIILFSQDPALKKSIKEIAGEIGAFEEDFLVQTNSMVIEFIPSKILFLQFDGSIFAEGFSESVKKNIEKIEQNGFQLQNIEKHNDFSEISVRIHIPSELFIRTRWFVYLFLDGFADKRIGRRWITE